LRSFVSTDVKYARTRDRGRRGVFEITNLKEHTHVWQQGNKFVRGEGEHVIVVHSEFIDNPVFIKVTIQNDPLRLFIWDTRKVPHHIGK
jgi:hypothetical protein